MHNFVRTGTNIVKKHGFIMEGSQGIVVKRKAFIFCFLRRISCIMGTLPYLN